MYPDSLPISGGKRLLHGSCLIPANRPLVSIVTVVLNAAADLERSIQSVINCDLKQSEYVIVDGGSTDGTLDILRKYEGDIDYWISQRDKGIYDAMNYAVKLAQGKWVCILGADDTLRQNLDVLHEYLRNDRTIYYGDVYKVGLRRTYDGPFGAWKLSLRNICQQSIFYPRSLFDLRQFNLDYPLLADWEFNLRCFADARFRFEYIPVTVANYNDVTGASSVKMDKQFWKDQPRILRECLPFHCYVWRRLKLLARRAVGPAKRQPQSIR